MVKTIIFLCALLLGFSAAAQTEYLVHEEIVSQRLEAQHRTFFTYNKKLKKGYIKIVEKGDCREHVDEGCPPPWNFAVEVPDLAYDAKIGKAGAVVFFDKEIMYEPVVCGFRRQIIGGVKNTENCRIEIERAKSHFTIRLFVSLFN